MCILPSHSVQIVNLSHNLISVGSHTILVAHCGPLTPAEFWGGLGQNSDKHLNSEWPPHSHFAKQNSARPDCLQTAICATGRILLRLTPKLHAEASVERSGNCWKISHRQIADCRLQIADCRFQMAGHSKSVPPRLQISDCEEQPHPGFSSPTSPITPIHNLQSATWS